MSGAAGQGDWVANALTAIGMIASVGVVLYQLGKQHRSSLRLQRNNAREALKLRVYELLGEKAQAFSDAESEAASYARAIIREFESASWAARIGLPSDTTALRAQQLSMLHFAASSALTELIVTIENWEIAFPAAELFRIAFSSANQDIEETFSPFFSAVLRYLPMDLPDGTVINSALPSAEQIDELKKLLEAYTEARATLRSYTHDLVVEAQNLLLSKLFKRRVKIRKPIDMAYKVVTAADADDLMHYFKNETPAGREWADASRRVRERLLGEGREPRD